MKRDYYEVLGVPRDADLQQIKKAYRKLARAAPSRRRPRRPRGEEKFKEATEAYEVLCDPQKRSALRRLRARRPAPRRRGRRRLRLRRLPRLRRPLREPLRRGVRRQAVRGGFGGQQRGPARGDDLAIEVELTLEEAAFGVEKEITFTAQGVCADL